MRGKTMLDLGARNELIVLAAIRHAPEGTSQSEVVDRSGLSRQAVSLITRRLRERGMITTDGTLAGSRGKPRTVLRLVPTSLLAAGVHLDPAGITLVLADLLAEVIAERRLEAPTDDPAGDITRIAEALASIVEELADAGWRTPDGRGPEEALLGIGVASPGGIDVRRGVVVNPPWLPGWRGVELVEQLAEASGLPVVLDKDTNAALTAHTWSAAQSSEETVLYIYVGAGVGSAVSSGHRVQHGSGALAGEIGHLPTGLDGEVCGCGRRACLSQFTDVSILLTGGRRAGILPADGEAGGKDGGGADGTADADPGGKAGRDAGREQDTRSQLQDLVAAADGGSEPARALTLAYGAALGEALRTLIGVHDPHRVVLGGPYWTALAPQVMPVIEARVRRDAPPERVQLMSSTLGDEVAALGAATLFLQRELSPAAR